MDQNRLLGLAQKYPKPFLFWLGVAGLFLLLLIFEIPNSIRIDKAVRDLRVGLNLESVSVLVVTKLQHQYSFQVIDRKNLDIISALLRNVVEPYKKERKPYDFTMEVKLTTSDKKNYFLTLFVDQGKSEVNAFFSTTNATLEFGLWFDDPESYWYNLAVLRSE